MIARILFPTEEIGLSGMLLLRSLQLYELCVQSYHHNTNRIFEDLKFSNSHFCDQEHDIMI